jgi:hypothetical protein
VPLSALALLWRTPSLVPATLSSRHVTWLLARTGHHTALTLQELESLLTAYFSEHWTEIDTVLAANSNDLRADGLVCQRPLPPTSPHVGNGLHSPLASDVAIVASDLPNKGSPHEGSGSGLAGGRSAASLQSHGSVSSMSSSGLSTNSRASRRARRNWQRGFQVCKPRCLASRCGQPRPVTCRGIRRDSLQTTAV